MPSREARGGGRREGNGQGGVRYIIRNTVRRRFPNFFLLKKFLRSDTESAEGHRNSESKKEEGEEKGEAAAEGEEEVDGQKKKAGLGAR